MVNRRGFLLILMVVVLSYPAEQTVYTWCRRQLAVNPEGSFLHGVGEIGVSILP